MRWGRYSEFWDLCGGFYGRERILKRDRFERTNPRFGFHYGKTVKKWDLRMKVTGSLFQSFFAYWFWSTCLLPQHSPWRCINNDYNDLTDFRWCECITFCPWRTLCKLWCMDVSWPWEKWLRWELLPFVCGPFWRHR